MIKHLTGHFHSGFPNEGYQEKKSINISVVETHFIFVVFYNGLDYAHSKTL